MARIVVMGAGIGGISQVYELRKALGKEHDLVLLGDSNHFEFTPSNPWVAVGWRTREDISFAVQPYLQRKGIEFIPVAAARLSPDENRVTLADGRTVDYDYLLIATGPRLAFEEVEVGVTGVDFAVAESGTLCLVHDEKPPPAATPARPYCGTPPAPG